MARGGILNRRQTFCQPADAPPSPSRPADRLSATRVGGASARIIHLEFTERFRVNYLVIIEPRRRLLMVEKVINQP
jgi:hypothetical protein